MWGNDPTSPASPFGSALFAEKIDDSLSFGHPYIYNAGTPVRLNARNPSQGLCPFNVPTHAAAPPKFVWLSVSFIRPVFHNFYILSLDGWHRHPSTSPVVKCRTSSICPALFIPPIRIVNPYRLAELFFTLASIAEFFGKLFESFVPSPIHPQIPPGRTLVGIPATTRPIISLRLRK